MTKKFWLGIAAYVVPTFALGFPCAGNRLHDPALRDRGPADRARLPALMRQHGFSLSLSPRGRGRFKRSENRVRGSLRITPALRSCEAGPLTHLAAKPRLGTLSHEGRGKSR